MSNKKKPVGMAFDITTGKSYKVYAPKPDPQKIAEGIYGNRVFFDYGDETLSFANPNPNGLHDSLAYELIHSDRELSRNERLVLASVIESYAYLILNETNETRNRKANAIKRVLKGARP